MLAALLLGAALLVPVGNAAAAVPLALDTSVSTHQSASSSTVTSPAFSTTGTNELLLAFVSSDGPASGNAQAFSAVTGGGLSWTLRQRSNAQAGTAEIWSAVAPSTLSGVSVVATHSGSYQASITVAAFAGADTATLGAVAGGHAASGAPGVSLTSTAAGSLVWGVGNDWDGAVARTVGTGQTKVDEFLASSGDTFWVQRLSSPVAAAGTVATLSDTAPTTDQWNLAAIEIRPAPVSGGDTTMPSVTLTAPAAGATVSGTVAVTATANDNVGVVGVQFLLDGANLGAEATTAPYAYQWPTTTVANGTHTLSATARDAAGNKGTAAAVTVTVSNPVPPPPGLALDATVSGHQSSSSATVTSPAFSTSGSNELLVAFVSADGPNSSGGQAFSGVSGAGSSWTLRQRSNAQNGTAEIWTAVAASALNGVTVSGTHSGSYTASVTVAAFKGADTATPGAVAHAASGAPSVSLTTTVAGSLVWGVGEDWDHAVARTVGGSQTKVDEFLAPSNNTYWVQRLTSPVATAGTLATLNDTAPTTDQWNLAAIEIRPAPAAGGDTTLPTVQLTAPASGATVSGTVSVAATANDNVGVVGVQFLLDGANLGAEVTAAPYAYNWSTTTVPNGTHTLGAVARDAAGNRGNATAVTVTVSNTTSSTAPSLDASTPAATAVLNNVISTSSPGFSPPANSLLYGVFSMDSASYTGSVTTVSSMTNTGTPLTWHLLGRENHFSSTAGGFLEVWWAYNPGAQASIRVTGTFNQATKNVPAPVGDFQVLVVDNAAADQSAASWSVNYLLSSKNNSPFVDVTSTRPNSLVLATFDNWDNSEMPVPAAGQSIQSVVLNPTDRDGYWVQMLNSPTAVPATVRMSATDPGIANEWHALGWEILAA